MLAETQFFLGFVLFMAIFAGYLTSDPRGGVAQLAVSRVAASTEQGVLADETKLGAV